MDLSQVLTGLESAKRTYQTLVSEAAEPLKEQLSAAVKELGIKGIVWTQYTPHFNDGDECVFSVNEPSLIVGEVNDVDSAYDEDNTVELYGSYKHAGEYTREKLEAAGIDEAKYDAIKALLDKFVDGTLEDVFRAAFGDHALVKVTPDYVNIIEYDHD